VGLTKSEWSSTCAWVAGASCASRSRSQSWFGLSRASPPNAAAMGWPTINPERRDHLRSAIPFSVASGTASLSLHSGNTYLTPDFNYWRSDLALDAISVRESAPTPPNIHRKRRNRSPQEESRASHSPPCSTFASVRPSKSINFPIPIGLRVVALFQWAATDVDPLRPNLVLSRWLHHGHFGPPRHIVLVGAHKHPREK
jgi:hypothetical protein